MFQEIFLIIFDRRHIKDIRLWVILIVVIASVSSFFTYHKYVIKPMQDRIERQGKRIRQIIDVAHLRSKIDALPKDESRGESH